MGAYHQMGHDSENLLREPALAGYRGAILSPVNYSLSDVHAQVEEFASRPDFELIFDPQLYVPTSERGCLRQWPYFPADVDTADLHSEQWWGALLDDLSKTASELGQVNVCSPAILPKSYSDEYFLSLVRAGEMLRERLRSPSLRVIQTVVASLAELTVEGSAMRIASILSQSGIDRIYLVLVGSTEPRRELADAEELKGAMSLIRLLASSGMQILVGYSSSDMLLWRHAGATDCASGKFFNLRRFLKSRFEEPAGGGGQLPYWFEETLIAFLRESDLIRVQKASLLSDSSTRNPYCSEILVTQAAMPGSTWLAKAWRQYLWWFADAEARISAGEVIVPALLKEAEQVWTNIEDTILMEEPRNDGKWLRAWRRACIEFTP